MSRFAPSGRPRSGLTLTRDHSPTLPRKGQGSPLPLCLAASVKTGVKGDAVPLVGGVKGRAKPTPCKGGIASSNPHTCKEINTGIYFAFFVAPSGVILSSILLDSVSSRLLDNRSLWGDTTTPP